MLFPDLNSCQLCLVQNCFTQQDRHSRSSRNRSRPWMCFWTVWRESAYDKAGPHVMWASGLLYDNITSDNGIVCANNGNAGAAGNPGQGWTGANCSFWNCAAGSSTDGFDIEQPPTTHKLAGQQDQSAGVRGLRGRRVWADAPYVPIGANVFPNSLMRAVAGPHRRAGIADPRIPYRRYQPVHQQHAGDARHDLEQRHPKPPPPACPSIIFAW